jgi:hypothetical protein
VKKTDIAVNGYYAYARGRYSAASKVRVADVGKYGRLTKYIGDTLNRGTYRAICERAGLAEDTRFIVADENATVAVQYVDREGVLSGTVHLVAARHLRSSWLDHEVEEAERRAEQQRRAAERDQWLANNIADGIEFHAEVLRFAKAAENARVLFDVKDRGFGTYAPIDAIGIIEVNNASADGRGTTRSVTLNRQAVQRLTALLESLDVDPTTLWTVEEVAA